MGDPNQQETPYLIMPLGAQLLAVLLEITRAILEPLPSPSVVRAGI